MKRFFCLLALMLLLALPACAATTDSAVREVLASAYPAADISQIAQWGDTAAAVFEQDSKNILCILEKRDGAWKLVVNSATVLLQNEALPSLLLDTDEALFWSYPNIYPAAQFSANRFDGVWRFSEERSYESLNFGKRVLESSLYFDDAAGCLRYHTEYRDENDNLVMYGADDVIPAMWLSDHLSLDAFDIGRFPALIAIEYEGQWPEYGYIQDAAQYLMPTYTLVGGSFAHGHLQFLMDKPSGERVFVGCICEGSDVRLAESAPLPKNTEYGVENYVNSLGVTSDTIVTLGYFPRQGRWGLQYLMDGRGDETYFGPSCILYRWETLYFGGCPWSDMTNAADSLIPTTISEAVDVLKPREDCAMVRNPDPADRLHLREAPNKSAKSLGKYYSGTPVRVLEEQGDWARVELLGRTGWMMKRYLDHTQPMKANLSVFPQITMKQSSALLYEVPEQNAETRELLTDYGLLVIGILEDEWYHVWFPRTDETGYLKQSEWDNVA